MAPTPEMRFLALCLPIADQSNLPLIPNAPALDWTVLIRMARWQGMMPLLAQRLLSSSPAAEVPAAVLSELRLFQQHHLMRSLSQTAALAELQREFDRARLPVLSWKGPSVGLLLYGAATLRDSTDLDFLLRKEDVHQVLQITRQLGYVLLGSSDSESKDIYILTLQREFTFGRQRDHMMLEFHLQTMPSRFTLWQDTQADFARATTTCPLADVELCMQHPEDLLVSLCAHATKHNWDRLKWSCDIAQFLGIYGSDLNWAHFFFRLRRARKDAVVLLGLAVAQKLYGLSLPAAVLPELQKSPHISTLADGLTDHIMSGWVDPITASQGQQLIGLLCPRLRDRIAYRLLPIVELNYEDLYIPVQNRMLFFMNYVFRVVRLLRKYGAQRLARKTANSVRSVR